MKDASFLSRALPLIIFTVVAAFLAVGLTKDPSKLPSNLIDRPLPNFELPGLRNGEGTLTESDLQGKVSLLNVFGSWCQACLIEHPTLLKLRDREAFDLVGINWRDTEMDARNWLTRYGDPYDYILSDANSELAIKLGVTGAPETFIIGSQGRIRYKHVGPITDDVFQEKIEPVVNALLAEMQK